jgi:hypothetical protein
MRAIKPWCSGGAIHAARGTHNGIVLVVGIRTLRLRMMRLSGPKCERYVSTFMRANPSGTQLYNAAASALFRVLGSGLSLAIEQPSASAYCDTVNFSFAKTCFSEVDPGWAINC